jgi:DNA-directed RNA polymerase subunit omega
MARITIEDCTEKVPNRFHLVKMASIRTKQLKKGAQSLVGSEDNKEVVLSLREIAAGFVKPDYPEEAVVDSDETLEAGLEALGEPADVASEEKLEA